jgi:hypothetical protein
MAAIGQIPHRKNITAVTNSNPCTITTEEELDDFSTGDQVRITGLNGMMPYPRGQDPINNYKFEIVKTGDYQFYIRNPITHIPIDSTTFPPYAEGGEVNKIATQFTFYGDEQDEQNEVT